MIVLLVLGGYLLGSIPEAWLLTELVAHRDLRTLGSGNVGVMNTALSVHRWTGVLVFAAELAKGALAVVLAKTSIGDEVAVDLTVLATFVGTRYPIWLRGHGGRGNSAIMAALALISWQTLAIMAIIYLAGNLVTRSNFLAMRLSLLIFPIVFGLVTQSWWSLGFGVVFGIVFLSTHKPTTDDHLLIKARYPNLWAFLTAPPRERITWPWRARSR